MESTHRRPESVTGSPEIIPKKSKKSAIPCSFESTPSASVKVCATIPAQAEANEANEANEGQKSYLREIRETESIVTNCMRVSIVPGTEAKFILKMSSVS